MKIYLLRHAERGHGNKQDTLTKNGMKQAEKTARYFKNVKIGKIISGTSMRARATTKPLLKYVSCPVEYTSNVNEQSLGVLQGKTASEWRGAVAKAGVPEKEFRPRGGENVVDAFNRAKQFVEKLKSEKVENILVVSHSGFISHVTVILLGKQLEESINFKTKYCAVSYFDLDKSFKIKDFKINYLVHLS